MMPQPIFDAVEHSKSRLKNAKVVYMSPQGIKLDNRVARELAKESELIILCGHYEGVDQRVIDELCDMELSIGGLCADRRRTRRDGRDRLGYEVYTRSCRQTKTCTRKKALKTGFWNIPSTPRPADYNGLKVPEVLLSGHHENIRKWRRQKQLEKTKKLRPDLIFVRAAYKRRRKISKRTG